MSSNQWMTLSVESEYIAEESDNGFDEDVFRSYSALENFSLKVVENPPLWTDAASSFTTSSSPCEVMRTIAEALENDAREIEFVLSDTKYQVRRLLIKPVTNQCCL
jgi:hypothetical protein